MGDSTDLIKFLSKQYNLELTSFYLYTYLEDYCRQSNVMLPGLAKFFKKEKKEELKHAQGILEMALKCNLTLEYMPIEAPKPFNDVKNVRKLIETCIDNEKKEYTHIKSFYKAACDCNNFAICLFLDAYICEQEESINTLECMLTQIKKCKSEFEVLFFDSNLK